MIISDYKVGTTFKTTCAKVNRKICGETLQDEYIYDSFGIDPEHAYFWGRKNAQIVNVKCTIIEEDVMVSELFKYDSDYDENQVDYFGYINFEDQLDISMIYPNIKLYFICFPYGPDCKRFYSDDVINVNTREIKHHKGDRRGMTVRLKIEEI